MNSFSKPFNIPLDPQLLVNFPFGNVLQRRLSQLRDYYQNQEAVVDTLASSDPIIYEVWELEYEGEGRGISLGTTRILPGTIGGEFYFTRGHFHAEDDGDELYVVLEGKGALATFTHDGESEVVEMFPGNLYYVPGNLAHRTINIGNEDFVFLSIWPPHIDHDYGSITETGFPKLVFASDNGPQILTNPQYKREQKLISKELS